MENVPFTETFLFLFVYNFTHGYCIYTISASPSPITLFPLPPPTTTTTIPFGIHHLPFHSYYYYLYTAPRACLVLLLLHVCRAHHSVLDAVSGDLSLEKTNSPSFSSLEDLLIFIQSWEDTSVACHMALIKRREKRRKHTENLHSSLIHD